MDGRERHPYSVGSVRTSRRRRPGRLAHLKAASQRIAEGGQTQLWIDRWGISSKVLNGRRQSPDPAWAWAIMNSGRYIRWGHGSEVPASLFAFSVGTCLQRSLCLGPIELDRLKHRVAVTKVFRIFPIVRHVCPGPDGDMLPARYRAEQDCRAL